MLFAEARQIFVNNDGMVYVNSGKGELAVVSADLRRRILGLVQMHMAAPRVLFQVVYLLQL